MHLEVTEVHLLTEATSKWSVPLLKNEVKGSLLHSEINIVNISKL